MSGDQITTGLSRALKVLDGLDDLRVAHVARGVIVLVNGKDARVVLVRLVKLLEIPGFFVTMARSFARA
jgi:hypothetical protein